MRDTEYERLLNHIREGDITAIVTQVIEPLKSSVF